MTEAEPTGLDVLASAASGLPMPVQRSFMKALSSLLGGLTAIPAAKLNQYAQAIEDTTKARAAVATALANALVDDASSDPALLQAAAEIYLPTSLRKAKNRLKVAQKAAEHVAGQASASEQSEPPGDDWMNCFARFAEDASSEQLQDLFGRILAGQVAQPHSFGLATLRAVSELDQTIATDFSFAWERSVGYAVNNGPEWQRGESFMRWARLSEAGLMQAVGSAQYLPEFNPIANGCGLWSPMNVGDVFVVVHFQEGSSARWDHIAFTRVGREIGSILPRPDYETNLRMAARLLPRDGLTRIDLHVANKPIETIWEAAS